ncbi:MAG: hypothetical protein SNJ63_02475 [Sphingomonadaceae bacterium]
METALVLANFVLVAITGFYAFWNYKKTRLVESQVENDTRPFVLCSLVFRQAGGMLNLSIENVGKRAAKNLSLRLSHPVYICHSGDDLRSFPPFQDKLLGLAPGQRFEYSIGIPSVYIESVDSGKNPGEFSITVTYFSNIGKKYVEEFFMSFAPFGKSALLTKDSDFLLDYLKKVERCLLSISTSLRKLENIVDRRPET